MQGESVVLDLSGWAWRALLDRKQVQLGKYCATLDDALKKIRQINPNFVFQQDNARHHTSKHTKSYLNNDRSRFEDQAMVHCTAEFAEKADQSAGKPSGSLA